MLASAVAVAQGQSTRLWLWGLGVQIPSATPVKTVTWGLSMVIHDERPAMTGVVVEFDRSAGRWVAACDDPGGEERLVVSAETHERAQRLLDERWRSRLELLDHEEEEER